jgi:hypothetical protein
MCAMIAKFLMRLGDQLERVEEWTEGTGGSDGNGNVVVEVVEESESGEDALVVDGGIGSWYDFTGDSMRVAQATINSNLMSFIKGIIVDTGGLVVVVRGGWCWNGCEEERVSDTETQGSTV